MKYPRIKPILYPFRTTNNSILLGAAQYGISADVKEDSEGTIWQLMQLMDGSRNVARIVRDMTKKYPSLTEQSIEKAIADLNNQGFVEEAKPDKPTNLSDQELERYSRSTHFFAFIDRKPQDSPYVFQSKLKDSRVTILGVGAVGGSIALGLASSGVGSIHLIDHDKVELSNLNRQVLFKEEDIGKSKVTAAIRNLKSLNSTLQITGEEMEVTTVQQVERLMKECDLFVLCADTPYFQIQQVVNKAALKTKTPWTRSTFTGPLVRASMIVPFQTPCWECINHYNQLNRQIHPLDPNQETYPPTVFGGLAPIALICGQIIAFQIILYLAGFKPKIMGADFRQSYLLLDHVTYTPHQFWKDCPACGSKQNDRR